MIQEHVENKLKQLLQRNISLQIKDKVLKEGRLILFNIKDFYVIFTLRNAKGEVKKYETPLPFDSYIKDGVCVFDYQFNRLTTKNSPLYFKIVTLTSTKKSKFYNAVMHIRPV